MVLALLVLVGGASWAASGGDDPDAAQVKLALALARTDSFYLVLDLRRAELHLMLGGVPLRTFPYTVAAVASPRVAFTAGRTPRDWTGRVWRDGGIAPAPRRERAEITPPPVGSGAAPEIVVPPLPGDGPPPPARFLVRFADGLELEIRREGDAGATGLRDRLGLLADPRRPHLRLRLTLSADHATDLYRCLPPGVLLVVLGRPA
ncbi:MAG: hypothetical protein IH621_00510 [Krumholzibacteria bacterium]|nr:hypothetical protein [Candidatus Krumholzibacteria bacterium]